MTKTAMTKIHTVRQPFFCRRNQFIKQDFPGQVLVIGIDLHALQTHDPYEFKIGKNPTVYTASSADVMRAAYIWTNKKGRQVAIVPVAVFAKKGEIKACQKEECLIGV